LIHHGQLARPSNVIIAAETRARNHQLRRIRAPIRSIPEGR
jgi:hypothetical protein